MSGHYEDALRYINKLDREALVWLVADDRLKKRQAASIILDGGGAHI